MGGRGATIMGMSTVAEYGVRVAGEGTGCARAVGARDGALLRRMSGHMPRCLCAQGWLVDVRALARHPHTLTHADPPSSHSSLVTSFLLILPSPIAHFAESALNATPPSCARTGLNLSPLPYLSLRPRLPLILLTSPLPHSSLRRERIKRDASELCTYWAWAQTQYTVHLAVWLPSSDGAAELFFDRDKEGRQRISLRPTGMPVRTRRGGGASLHPSASCPPPPPSCISHPL